MAKVLVVDDDGAMRRLLRRILEGAGHVVVEAEDGRQGVKSFHTEAPDLVITDVVMPEQEGIQTIRDIRASGSRVGIIAMSGGGADGGALYLNMAQELGADAVLSKPMRAPEVIAQVDAVLKQRALRD